MSRADFGFRTMTGVGFEYAEGSRRGRFAATYGRVGFVAQEGRYFAGVARLGFRAPAGALRCFAVVRRLGANAFTDERVIAL